MSWRPACPAHPGRTFLEDAASSVPVVHAAAILTCSLIAVPLRSQPLRRLPPHVHPVSNEIRSACFTARPVPAPPVWDNPAAKLPGCSAVSCVVRRPKLKLIALRQIG